MLRQHIVRESIAQEKHLENNDILKKKYFIRQNVPMFKQPLPQLQDERDSASNIFNMTNQKPFFQSLTSKPNSQKISLHQSENEIISLETSFNQPPQNKFMLKLQLPHKDQEYISPKSNNKAISQKNKSVHYQVEGGQAEQFNKHKQCIHYPQVQNTQFEKQKKTILKTNSTDIMNLKKKRHYSLTKVDDQSANLQYCKTSQEDVSQQQRRVRKQLQVSTESNANHSSQKMFVKSQISPLYSRSPAGRSSLNSFSKFQFSNIPTQTTGPFIDLYIPIDATPKGLTPAIKRRSSLNFPNPQETNAEHYPSQPLLIDKKESRMASLTRIQELDRQKFKEEVAKMYIEKRVIADDEDIDFVKKLQQLDDDQEDNAFTNKGMIENKMKFRNTGFDIQEGNVKDETTTTKLQTGIKKESNVRQLNGQNVIYDKVCERPSTVIGEEAPEIFYNHYKKINKIIEQNQFYGEQHSIKESLQTKLVKSIIDKNMLPKKLNLICSNKNSNSLSFSHYNCGESSAQVIADGLLMHPLKDQIQQFSLKNSYLNSSICSTLLKSIPNTIIDLNLSKNDLDVQALNYITLTFLSANSRLQVLNLEKCKIQDETAAPLLECLVKNQSSLRKLNLSQNYLTSISCSKLKQILEDNYYLEELYLHWNQIKGEGGVLIAQGLQSNTTITVLDLSKNPLGGSGNNNKVTCSKEIQNFLMFPQTNLTHLDLSNCGFTMQESTMIKEGLIHNHSIFGFHFSGNVGFIDALGFLNISKSVNSFRNIHLNHRIDGVFTQTQLLNKERSIVSIDNCWICEGWEEQEICIDQSQLNFEDISFSDLKVFAHIDFLDFRGLLMEYDKTTKCFCLKIMSPPNQTIKFFLSIPEKDLQIISSLHQSINRSSVSDLSLPSEVLLTDGTFLKIKVEELTKFNSLKTKVGQVIDESTFHPLVSCIPRPIFVDKDKQQQYQNAFSNKQKWTLNTSIWRKQAQINHKQICKDSFDFDFAASKISKLIKDESEIETCKEILLKHYKKIRDLYKGLSFAGAIGNNFFVSLNLFNEFMVDSEFIDNVNIKVSDIDVKFVAACASRPNNSIRIGSVSDRGLSRFQFIELIVRLIQEKYINSGLGYTMSEAFEDFFQKEAIRSILRKQHSAHKWRKNEFWNEECFLVIKEYMFFLQAIFNFYSNSSKNNTIKIKFLMMEEFKQFFRDTNCNQVAERDMLTSFGYSIMYQVDELYSERYIQMQFLEFVESIARLAAIANIQPHDSIHKTMMTFENYEEQPNLSQQIQGFLQYIYCQLPIEEIINQSLSSSLKYHLDQTFEKKGISRFKDNGSQSSNSQTPSLRFNKTPSTALSVGNQQKITLHRKSISQFLNISNFRDSRGFKKQNMPPLSMQQQMSNGISQFGEENGLQKSHAQLNQQKSLSPLKGSKRLSIYQQIEQKNPTKKKDLQKIIQNALQQNNNSLLTTLSNFKKKQSSTTTTTTITSSQIQENLS